MSETLKHDRTLQGRRAAVTGGSSGIGRAIALTLAQHGAHVWIHGRDQARADEVAHQIEANGVESLVTLGDLGQADTIDAVIEAADRWQPDIWVNNAGFDVLTGEPAGWTFEQKLEALWKVDVLACMRLSRAIGQAMKARGGGVVDGADSGAARAVTPVIINIGWDQAQWGMEGDSGEMFGAIKSAVMGFTRSLAKSLAPDVRVNCVAPGWIKTSWGEQASDYWHQRAEHESLLQRWGLPEDVAAAVRFLVSGEASFLTGVTIPVNGGFRTDRPR